MTDAGSDDRRLLPDSSMLNEKGMRCDVQSAPSMSSSRVRVVVVDDHPVFLDGLTSAIRLRPTLELAGQAQDGHDAIALIRDSRPDVAVVDIRLPGLDGSSVLSEVKRSGAGTRVLLLSAVTTGSLVYGAIRDGADGFVAKTASRDAICDAIECVARGETYLSPELSGSIAEQIRAQSVQPPSVLTSRENEILRHVAGGLRVHQVASALNLSVSTVKTHQEHIYAKLGVTGAPAAVAEAMRRGLLS
jgi:two-component system, NarL family, nitrate/nitrite response regulator NarL